MKDLPFPDGKDISLTPSCPRNSDMEKMSMQMHLYSTGGSREPTIGKLIFVRFILKCKYLENVDA